jgi:WD40 repeat protein
MFRIVFFAILLAAIILGVGWHQGYFPVVAGALESVEQGPSPATRTEEKPKVQLDRPKERVQPPRQLVAQLAPPPALPPARPDEPPSAGTEPIVIANARLKLVRQQDVPSQREGVLLFVGYLLKDGEQAPKDEPIWEYKRGDQTMRFRRLREGDVVNANQLLAVVDFTLAEAEVGIKNAKLIAAIADRTASEHTRDEAKQRYDTQIKLKFLGRGATSDEDVRGAQLTWVRYIYEEKSKAEAIKVAEEEKKQAKKTLDMYEIYSKIPGVVKTIYKHDGESVKALDPVLQIQNYDVLRVDGLADEQYKRSLHEGDEVVLEPTRRERPSYVFKRHKNEINGVAVSWDPQKPLVVSASEDGTAIVWDLATESERWILDHHTPVKAVACLPGAAKEKHHNWCLTGAADGYARLWDLNNATAAPLELKGHRKPVTAVAFSPTGELCATGGDDGEIMLWKTEARELVAPVVGHRPGQAITALHFTAPDQFVSVSRDNTIRVWKLDGKNVQAAGDPIERRGSSDVVRLGVSPDGKHILDPQAYVMSILSLPDGRVESGFQNPSQASQFKNFALFSPDGRLVLTTSSTEGVLQLWKTSKRRSFELRQLNPSVDSPATCAAFDPNGKFVVGGTKDRRVYVWPMPSQTEVTQVLTAKITSVGQVVESTGSQVPITAEFDNRQAGLLVGDSVTIVAEPRK